MIGSAEARLIDEAAQALGVSPLQLMESAGRAVADVICSRLPIRGRTIVVVAGTGNNGGDGFVVARYLAARGAHVHVILLGSEREIRTEEARANWRILRAMPLGVELHEVSSPADLRRLADVIRNADVVIDAIFGIGLRGKVVGLHADAISLINESRGLKVAVDVPSGLNADTGEVMGVAVSADVTVTFVDMKPGLARRRDLAGEVIVADIGVPEEAKYLVTPSLAAAALRPRRPDSKKGDHGRVLVVGGSESYSGAPALAALAALRMGADLAVVVCPRSAATPIKSFSPSLIVLPSAGEGRLESSRVPEIIKLAEKFDAVLIGPGLGLHEDTFDAVVSLVSELRKPLVLDADALKAVARDLSSVKGRAAVLTPHAGEFRILFNREAPAGLRARIRAVEEAAKLLEGAVVLLKGPVDVISDGSRTRINMTGNAFMTVGGTGDTLSGIVAALLAAGNPPFEAACAAAFINGLAGELASSRRAFITPTDLLAALPEVVRRLRPPEALARFSPIFTNTIAPQNERR